MNQEAWPTPHEPSREPLPRVEDLPIAEQGYEPDSVRAAFDSFYRHAAQLDAALRTLEAVDSFHRQAAALRADIRTLRTAGWTQQPWTATPTYGYQGRAPREGVSPAVWRIAGEAAFLIAVAVGLGVAKLSWWLIVLVMAVAWLLVGLIEWASARDRFAPSRPVAEPPLPVVEGTPPGRTEEEPLGWTAFEEAQEPSDAMTMIGAPPVPDDAAAEPASEAAPDDAGQVPEPEQPAAIQPELSPDEPEPVDEAASFEQLEEPAAAEPAAGEPPLAAADTRDEPAETPRRWWKRRRGDGEPAQDAVAVPAAPRHVRVLPGDEQVERDLDPWEAGFDADGPEEPEAAAEDVLEPAEETDEDAAAFAADADDAAQHRFRRR